MATIPIASTTRRWPRIRVVAQEQYIPLHQHRKGQLIMALGSDHL